MAASLLPVGAEAAPSLAEAISEADAKYLKLKDLDVKPVFRNRLLDLAAVMPHLGYGHVGAGGRIVPNSVFFDLSTWHLIPQAYTRKAMHFAKELWTDYTDQTLHRRLMGALEGQHGHRMLASVEAAKARRAG